MRNSLGRDARIVILAGKSIQNLTTTTQFLTSVERPVNLGPHKVRVS